MGSDKLNLDSFKIGIYMRVVQVFKIFNHYIFGTYPD